MKQEISEHEAKFIRDGFRKNFRADGRSNTDVQRYKLLSGTIQEAFGSSTITFGESDI
jgi:exosome complex RNA-binding protein Rrp42 (RNase PH superfamily)